MHESDLLLSIIVPVWNMERHLPKFILSISPFLNDKRIEIIFIDDGSTDSSPDLLRELESSSDNVILEIVPNGGQGRAKNIAIPKSKGAYLWFIDPDDFLEISDNDTLLSTLLEGGFEVLVMGYRKVRAVSSNNQDWVSQPSISKEIVPSTSIIKLDELGLSAWNKIIKKSHLLDKNLYFIEGIIHEDAAVVPLWLAMAQNVCLDEIIRYNYVIHEQSSVHGNFSRVDDLFISLEKLAQRSHANIDAVGRVITKNLLFYNFPNWCSALGKGMDLPNLLRLHRKMTVFIRTYPRLFTYTTQEFSRLEVLFIRIALLPLLVSIPAVWIIKKIRNE